MPIRILAIESSCDDTSVAVMEDAKILSLGVSSQKIHAEYGGVVPELASRAHQQQIVPLVDYVMKESGLSPKSIDAVAFTQGPGLLGSLLVGTSFAKGFALAQDIPLISVNHMEAHILAHLIDDPKPNFPFICLTVSGGHTQIVLVKSPTDMRILGETLDDAAGEAFDKTGKMMGLPYPAGPIIDKLALQGERIYDFPIPQVGEFEFSFSGLKTSIRNFLIKNQKEDPEFIENNKENICRSVQDTIIEILLTKLELAAERFHITDLGIAGGVSANSGLRSSLEKMCTKNGWRAFIPDFKYCTDNAGMIAIAAHYKYLQKDFINQRATPNPRMKISDSAL